MSKDILEEALELTKGARNKDYGDCKVEFDRVAAMWSVIFEKGITPNQAALDMIALKITRQISGSKRDN